jgi:hypothetical protein
LAQENNLSTFANMEANSRMPLGPGLTSPDDKENSTPNKMNTSRPNSRSESAQALKTTNTNGTDHDKSVELGAKSRESLARNLQLASQDPNPAVRKAAQSALISAEEENYPKFILALVDLMAAPSRNEYVCQLAGLHVKNLLVANDNDGALQTKKHDKWMAIPPITRRAIQSNLLNAIRSPVCGTRNTAVLVGSEIAAIEIPDKEWLEFPSVMMENVTREGGDDGIKISSLHCIRMMYRRTEELMGVIPPEVTDLMLTTIVDGMRSNRPDPIRYAATRALGNSLSFARKNMENPAERDVILKMICEATKSADADVRSAANECIVQIAFQYYDKLQAYMQTLSQLTLATIRSDEAKVALQAIELWSTLAEKEMELNDMAAKLAETGQSPPPESVCFGYVSAASDELVPILAELLTRQDEEAEIDDDQWNPSMSGATCLQLVANTVKDAIVPRIMPFVRQHIQSNNWRYKEAAVMAISSILSGPSDDAIGPCVNQSISFVLTALSDPNVLVKDTAAWAISRICHLQVRLIPVDIFPTLVNGLAGKLLTETPRVSSKVCIGIYYLAAAQNDSAAATSGTNALSRECDVLMFMYPRFRDQFPSYHLTSIPPLPPSAVFFSLHGTPPPDSAPGGGQGRCYGIESSHRCVRGDDRPDQERRAGRYALAAGFGVSPSHYRASRPILNHVGIAEQEKGAEGRRAGPPVWTHPGPFRQDDQGGAPALLRRHHDQLLPSSADEERHVSRGGAQRFIGHRHHHWQGFFQVHGSDAAAPDIGIAKLRGLPGLHRSGGIGGRH